MALSEADMAEALVEVKIPDDPAELAKARGDAVVDVAAEPAVEPAKTTLTDADKAEADALAAPKAGEPAKEPAKEPAADKPRDAEGKFIPKGRFDEMRLKKDAQIKAAEDRATELEGRLKLSEGPASIQEAEAILEQKSGQYQGLLADGKLVEAQAVFKEINVLNRRIARLEIQPIVQELSSVAVRSDSLEGVIELYTSEFPEFREGTAEFSQDMVNQVSELQAAFQAAGHSPARALSKAADLVVKANQLAPSADRSSEPASAVPSPKGQDRKAAAVQANVKAAGQQPPGLNTLGTDSDKMGASKIDVEGLTQDSFAVLAKDEATLKRLRGDLL